MNPFVFVYGWAFVILILSIALLLKKFDDRDEDNYIDNDDGYWL